MNDMFSNGKANMCETLLQLTNGAISANRRNMGTKLSALAILGLFGSGCVQVAAPDKPIVINLNIGIRQEILYKLDAASKKVIEENPEIF
jgi:hypothetical protein